MSDSKIDTNEYVSQVLMVQAKDGTALGTIGEQDVSVGFSTSRVCETLCADEQFIGELVGIARSEIPGILAGANGRTGSHVSSTPPRLL